MKHLKYELFGPADGDSIDDRYDRGETEDDLRENPDTRDKMNDPDSPHYNG